MTMSETLINLEFTLNGERVRASVESHLTILEVLRNEFGLYGARESCGQGLCGCCTVVVNGETVSGCLYLAAMANGAEVTTVEHLDANGALDPLQQAFIECGAFQCGFCTSGFLMMSRQLLEENPDPTEAEIRHYLAGNLCRCGAYPEIIEAVKLAAQRRKEAALA
jgi:carbon-monoxide dehydrogenase small subunit